MTIKVSNSKNRGPFALSGLSASRQVTPTEVTDLSEAVDTEIIRRAVALAELVKLGVATCRDIDQYNQVAGEAWLAQIEFFQLLIAGGGVSKSDGGSIEFPNHPPLFSADGRFQARGIKPGSGVKFVESVCRGGGVADTTRIIVSDPVQKTLFSGFPGGFPGGNLNGLGAAPLLIPVAVRTGLWIVVTLAATTAVVGLTAAVVLSQTEEAKLNNAKVEFAKVALKINAKKSEHVLECVKSGRDAVECEAEAQRLFPDPAAPSSTPGFLDKTLGTAVKFGALFLAGSYLYRKIQEQ